MLSLVLAAWVSGAAHAHLASDPRWSRFQAARPFGVQAELGARFNRFVFREYRNLAVFAGDAYSGRVALLEDFLLHFPSTVVTSGHAALADSSSLTAALKPEELNLIVLDERLLPQAAALTPLLDRVDAWNRDGYVVKVIVNVNDKEAVLPAELFYRGEFFEFSPDWVSALRRTFDNFTPAPNRAPAWTDLMRRQTGRRKIVVLQLSNVVRSPAHDVLLLAGTAETNAGVVEAVQRALGTAPVLEYGGEATSPVPADEPRRRFDLNLVRVRVAPTLVGQWPPAEGLGALADTMSELNARGVFSKSVVEVTEQVQVPARVRDRVKVIATKQDCERLIRWTP